MTDRILAWFQCANPNCELVTKLGHSVTFLSYITGRKERDFDTQELLFISEDNDIGNIILYSDDRSCNSYVNPIKGIRYCTTCYKLIIKNESLEKYW